MDYCYACGRIGHENRSCRFVSRDEGERSEYGPELRTGRARKLSLQTEDTRSAVNDDGEIATTLTEQRSKVQSGEDGESGMITREERVGNPVQSLQPTPDDARKAHPSGSGSVLQVPGLNLSKEVSTMPFLSLQGVVDMDNVGTNLLGENYESSNSDSTGHAMGQNPSTFPSPIPKPIHIPSPEPQYFVTEPNDSPKSLAHTQCLSPFHNQTNHPSPGPTIKPTNNPVSPSYTHIHSPIIRPSDPLTQNNQDITVTNLNTESPTHSPTHVTQAFALTQTITTSLNNLSIKRKADDDPIDNRSKILRLCSPNPT
ncbi:hypothetical protein Vadar_017429 [Vaccinium darrowii]|uniref:Uncharacterized protein n=1 Tax=Vaccinium darrowii TaxID=229202 RepID=A0ACB7Z4H0_9ERIC|nr:hypothetical protein Vadar_017429 [Vaccinium darrowii]